MSEDGFTENENRVVTQASPGFHKNYKLANSLLNAENKLVSFIKLPHEQS